MAETDSTAEGCLEISRLRSIEETYGADRNKLVYEVAKYYASLGWPLLPAEYDAKTLPKMATMKKRGYDKTFKYADCSSDPKDIDIWFHPEHGLFAGYNIALVTGVTVSAVDLDIDADGNGHEEYVSRYGQLPDRSPCQRTPGGGYHFIFKHEKGFKTDVGVIPHVDTRGASAQNKPSAHIIVYPSVVTVGGKKIMYKWDRGGETPPVPTAFLKDLNKVTKIDDAPKNRAPGAGRGNEEVEKSDVYAEASFEDVAAAVQFLRSESYADWIDIGMAINSLFPGDDGFDLWHEWSQHVPGYNTQGGERFCRTKWKSFDPERKGGLTVGTIFKRARDNGWARPGQMTKSLDDQLRRDKNGKPLSNSIHNIWAIINSQDLVEHFGGPLRWDAFKNQCLAGTKNYINQDFVEFSVWFSTSFWIERSADTLRDYVIKKAKDDSFDSLREWVDDLKWDGVPRMDALYRAMRLSTDPALGAYERASVRRWMVGAMARAYEPGCTSTHMLVLHGDQGIGKSRFFRSICPFDDWFSDSTHFKFTGNNSIRDEETKLFGRWIIEVAEFEGHYKQESTAIKNFITGQVQLTVKKYEADATHTPRRCVFGASTNSTQIFNDPTGGRRFAVISLQHQKIDVDWVKENCTQLWAEVKTFYQAGEKWWFDQGETTMQNVVNREFAVVHPWRDEILEFVSNKSRFTTQDIFRHIGLTLERQQQKDYTTVSGILTEHGWRIVNTKVAGHNNPVRLWRNPDATIDNTMKGSKWELPPELRDADPEEY